MLIVDLVGLIVTICLIGFRYPAYVICAAILSDLGRILMILFFHGRIESIVAAGAFGTTFAAGPLSAPSYIIIFSGCMANFLISMAAGGLEYEKTRAILNPLAKVRHPFAVINLRLSLLSLMTGFWQILQ